MDSEITLRMENWRGGDWHETQTGAHVMRRKSCAMQIQGITLTAVGAFVTLTDFTLSNARRFYSSMGNPLALKGLTTSKTMSPLIIQARFPRCMVSAKNNRNRYVSIVVKAG